MKWVLMVSTLLLNFSLLAQTGESARRKIYRDLQLTHTQAKALFVVRKKKQFRLKKLKKELSRVQKKINTALIDDKPEKTLLELHRKKLILQAKIKQERFNSTLSMRRVLSKRQRKEYLQLKKKYAAKANTKKR